MGKRNKFRKHMQDNKFKKNPESMDFEEVQPEVEENIEEPEVAEEVIEGEENQEENSVEDKITSLETELAKEKKEYLFLMAEFDNFRKRTLKEKSEIIRNAGEQVLKGLLPIVDDFERGLKASADAQDTDSVKEGMELIYKKLLKYLEQNGVKEIDPEDRDFDTNRHEAISVVPVADEEQKGKILDTVEKGYMINDKVLRHAKVVVGQ